MARTTYEEINIGPFVGGLNTISDQTSISDTELYKVDNFELDQDGSLVSRPPLRLATPNSMPGSGIGIKIIGFFVDSATQAVYLIASDRVGKTYYLTSGVWTQITANFAATACTQFRDKLYLVAPLSSGNPGGTWTPGGGFVADAAMPKGVCIVSNKERLWIAQGKNATANGSRVYVTDIVSGLPVWNGNFISISSGDGQNVVDLCVYNSDLVVFKQSSTYRFSFGTDVATGEISTLSTTVGANNTGCYVSYEQQLYIVFNNNVYEFTNYIFNKLNITVPLYSKSPSTSLTEIASISAWASRLIVCYYDATFVYNLRNRTWSTWSSEKIGTFGQFFPIPFLQSDRPIAYVASTQPLGTALASKLFSMVDLIEAGVVGDAATSEAFDCMFETKNYDYQTSSKWKRLGLWSADLDARTEVTVAAQPVSYATSATWGEVSAFTWGQIAGNTWGRILEKPVIEADNVQVQGLTGGKKFVKFIKSLRFRQLSYKLTASTNGVSSDAPVRVYKLISFIKEKQLVSRKIN